MRVHALQPVREIVGPGHAAHEDDVGGPRVPDRLDQLGLPRGLVADARALGTCREGGGARRVSIAAMFGIPAPKNQRWGAKPSREGGGKEATENRNPESTIRPPEIKSVDLATTA